MSINNTDKFLRIGDALIGGSHLPESKRPQYQAQSIAQTLRTHSGAGSTIADPQLLRFVGAFMKVTDQQGLESNIRILRSYLASKEIRLETEPTPLSDRSLERISRGKRRK